MADVDARNTLSAITICEEQRLVQIEQHLKMAMGQNPVPLVNIPLPTKIDKNEGCAYPRMVPLVLTRSQMEARHHTTRVRSKPSLLAPETLQHGRVSRASIIVLHGQEGECEGHKHHSWASRRMSAQPHKTHNEIKGTSLGTFSLVEWKETKRSAGHFGGGFLRTPPNQPI